MREFDDVMLFEGIPEVFLGEGPHVFRVILDPEKFQSSVGVDVSVLCPDGRESMLSMERWGRKIRVSFTLTGENREGVFRAIVRSAVHGTMRERRFWVIR